MAGLSSMTSTRRFMIATGSPMTSLHRRQRQIQSKKRTSPAAAAFDAQFATELAGSERPAVQSESVSFLLGGKSVTEYTSQILGSDSDAVVADADSYTQPARGDPHRHDLLRANGLFAGMLGIADQVDKYLQHPVLVDDDRWHVLEFPTKDDSVTRQCTFIEAQAVFHKTGDAHDVRDAAEPRVVLLHRYNVLDVVDTVLEFCEFCQYFFLIHTDLASQFFKVAWQAFAPVVLPEERAQIGFVGPKQSDDPLQVQKS